MPSPQEPQQQAPMEMTPVDGVVTQQPVGSLFSTCPSHSSDRGVLYEAVQLTLEQAAEPQPEFGNMRGGEEAGCEICCGLCACDEGCC
ncbi:hypothetical protein F4814DRAFT_452877 [Daldinia grandis]|nr:hypothetical protein F4814DRAFT_452877 [Daldinia grandis]